MRWGGGGGVPNLNDRGEKENNFSITEISLIVGFIVWAKGCGSVPIEDNFMRVVSFFPQRSWNEEPSAYVEAMPV